MKGKRWWQIGLVVLACAVSTSLTLVTCSKLQAAAPSPSETKLMRTGPVPAAPDNVLYRGVSGPQEGANGVHSANGDLVGDGKQATLPQGFPLPYELRVWVWKCNLAGVFTAWSPQALCEDFLAFY
jgi:hypothetical protein